MRLSLCLFVRLGHAVILVGAEGMVDVRAGADAAFGDEHALVGYARAEADRVLQIGLATRSLNTLPARFLRALADRCPASVTLVPKTRSMTVTHGVEYGNTIGI